jgi:nucleotide-binding universal stress UspA family protein
MKTLIVPLDRSDRSEAALPVARAMADRTGADVVVVTATPDPPEGDEATYLTEAASSLDPIAARIEVTAAEPSVAKAIVAVAAGSTEPMLCMATHGRGALTQAAIGSTADAVLRLATEPVLLVGPSCDTTDLFRRGRLLVPLDGSVEAERVLPLAVTLAEQLELGVWLLRVVHPYDSGAAREIEELLDRPVQQLRAAGLEPHAEVMFSTSPGTCIAEHAETIDASLILMATHLRHGVARFVLGSATMSTVRAAPCPVVVTRAVVGTS